MPIKNKNGYKEENQSMHYVQKITEICYRLEKKTVKSSTLTASSTGIELSKELIFMIYIKIDVDFLKIIDSMSDFYLLQISDTKLGIV